MQDDFVTCLTRRSANPSEQLKAKLVQAEQARTKGRDGLKPVLEWMNQYKFKYWQH
ncbi:hypothetical protein O9992_02385 [Vibrio lentus]|nr:hypothetical protein [Vibrio lentus]